MCSRTFKYQCASLVNGVTLSRDFVAFKGLRGTPLRGFIGRGTVLRNFELEDVQKLFGWQPNHQMMRSPHRILEYWIIIEFRNRRILNIEFWSLQNIEYWPRYDDLDIRCSNLNMNIRLPNYDRERFNQCKITCLPHLFTCVVAISLLVSVFTSFWQQNYPVPTTPFYTE